MWTSYTVNHMYVLKPHVDFTYGNHMWTPHVNIIYGKSYVINYMYVLKPHVDFTYGNHM